MQINGFGVGELRQPATQCNKYVNVLNLSLLTAAFSFMNEILAENTNPEETEKMASLFRSKLLDCMEKDADGSLRMTIKLPDESALDTIANSLAGIVASRN